MKGWEPHGLIRWGSDVLEVRGVQNLKDDPSRVMEPQRKFVK